MITTGLALTNMVLIVLFVIALIKMISPDTLKGTKMSTVACWVVYALAIKVFFSILVCTFIESTFGKWFWIVLDCGVIYLWHSIYKEHLKRES